MVRLGICLGFVLLGAGTQAQWTASLLGNSGFDSTWLRGISGSHMVGNGLNYDSGTDTWSAHALVWNSDGTVNTDLHPASYETTVAVGVFGSTQVGFGHQAGGNTRALMWQGTAASMIELGPANWEYTTAVAASGLGQVGSGFSETQSDSWFHALYWQGSAGSMVDLNPAGYFQSLANGIGDDAQVGYGYGDLGRRALLWHGSAASAIDLTPVGFSETTGNGAWGTKQVGYGWNGAINHALLWSGSAASAVDLNPAGFDGSEANAVCGDYQVGGAYYAGTLNTFHAMIWQGSAASAVNLQDYVGDLPFSVNASIATGVTESGDVIGYVYDENWDQHFIRWSHVVPEPGSFLALTIGVAFFGRRRKRA